MAGKVSPVRALAKEEFQNALSADWLRIAPLGQRSSFAEKVLASEGSTISDTIGGVHLPGAHTILNSLVVDPTALSTVLLRYGGVFVPVAAGPCNDNAAISQLLRAATEYVERMQDGRRDHVDTLALADLFRPLIPAMLCVIEEANKLKGAA